MKVCQALQPQHGKNKSWLHPQVLITVARRYLHYYSSQKSVGHPSYSTWMGSPALHPVPSVTNLPCIFFQLYPFYGPVSFADISWVKSYHTLSFIFMPSSYSTCTASVSETSKSLRCLKCSGGWWISFSFFSSLNIFFLIFENFMSVIYYKHMHLSVPACLFPTPIDLFLPNSSPVYFYVYCFCAGHGKQP